MKNINTFVILIILLTSCNNKNNSPEENINIPYLIDYTIIEDKVTDTPGKTQILASIVVNQKDSLTNEKLEKLLWSLYNERMTRSDFRYRDSPNSVAVYAYLTKEKAMAGMGQWIAMVAKMPMDEQPAVSFNQSGLNSLDEKEESKWNLSYSQRQEIWNKIIFTERDAQTETDKTYPLVTGLTKEDLIKNGKLSESLKEKNEDKIIKEYKITKQILDSVTLEALGNDWAFPER